MELTVVLIMAVVLAAFVCEYADSTLGMGYGTTLTPLLLLMGFSPLQIVPIILLSELVTGLMAGICHHCEGNVDFREPQIWRVAVVFGVCGALGALISVVLAVSLPEVWVKRYIAFLIFGMGVFMIWMRNRQFSFSWAGIIGTGLLASFNKGFSGGGYGPLVCSGHPEDSGGNYECVRVFGVFSRIFGICSDISEGNIMGNMSLYHNGSSAFRATFSQDGKKR